MFEKFQDANIFGLVVFAMLFQIIFFGEYYKTIFGPLIVLAVLLKRIDRSPQKNKVETLSTFYHKSPKVLEKI